MKSAAVFFADGFEDVEALCPVDYLRRAGINVLTVGVKGKNEGKTKSDCDKQFLRDMQAVCNTHPESKKAWCTRHRGRRFIRYRCTKHPRKECKNLAAIYHWAVDTFGKGAYDNARKCCP